MSQRKLIARDARETPPELKSRSGRTSRLPNDLLQQASHRLQIMSLIAATLWVLGPLFGHLAQHAAHPEEPRWAGLQWIDAVAASGAITSLALYFYLRRKRDPAFVMDLSLVYLVVMAFALGVMMHGGPLGDATLDVSPTITWIGPVILMAAAIVPATPWKMLSAGLLAASMDPLGMVVWRHFGHYEFGPLSNLLAMHFPTYLMVGVAVIISQVVTRLGQQVARERALGSYRLGELLGQGGMGEVYRAEHRMLARPAAIKLIRPQILAEGDGEAARLAITRFRREADAAAHLRSPHTVALYDFGVMEDETLYFVMELLEGLDLETLVRQHGPLPANRVIHIVRQVCESLEEAHASGLVHRDIKPANIHLGRVGMRHDFAKVLDFGLVKSLAGVVGQDSLATAAGLTPGTPAYMAPEMASGETVDGRADIYALGCVAYYLLTGQLVFQAANTFQVLAKHLQETPVPPSQRTELEVPPALDRVILACLAKKPKDRPATATELDRLLAEIEVDPWTEQQAERWWSLHRGGAARSS
ncbi:MAG TPA: serine/threonine-protein kinase [Gemmatimonadales bacterium]|nr:serine/threonine-protein kinase [Gemmatimonadales bacterium]